MKSRFIFAGIFLAGLAFISCQPTVEPTEVIVNVTGVTLDKASLTLTQGDRATLTPTISPSDASNKDVTWSSSNEAVVTVDQRGNIMAIKSGSATVAVKTVDGGFSAECAILVDVASGAITGEATHISCRSAEISGRAILSQTTSADLAFGVLYSTSSGVLFGTATQIQARSFDSEYKYSLDTEVLEPETTYYYRSYLYQNGEITYGEVKSFATLPVSSMIKTSDATDINLKDAVLNAVLDLTDCSYESLEYGFILEDASGKARILEAGGLSSKQYSLKAENLTRESSYKARAYATLDGRKYEADVAEFTTAELQAEFFLSDATVVTDVATINGTLTVLSSGNFTKSAKLYWSDTLSEASALKAGGSSKVMTLSSDGSFFVVLSGLKTNDTYYYMAVATVDGKDFESKVLEFATPGIVDLGLSVKWAACNLGAEEPEEYGGYYQWAGTTDVSSTSIYLHFSNCPYHTGSSADSGWTKYNTISSYGTVDNKTVLEAEDDAAHVILGGKWRMPADAEWTELRNTSNCSWTWTTINGVNGYKVQSLKRGYTDNYIFLPAAGSRQNGSLNGAGSDGEYWSSSLRMSTSSTAWAVFFDSSEVNSLISRRYFGHSVRPVLE